ncbi:MAG: 30S ribosome-binding factor RbfA [Candidatus Omnitrophica bacterium]|nr:30S ribosome-binding factor RbfA [Candidatus Omnitrophota bacterium]
MKDRMGRVDELIKRELSFILIEDVEDPRVAGITITGVEVTKDLSIAKIFYLYYGSAEEKVFVGKALRKAAGFIRGRLAKKISIKSMPRLDFVEDRTEERQEEVERLFKLIEKERPPSGEPAAGEERNKDEQGG